VLISALWRLCLWTLVYAVTCGKCGV